MYSIGYGMNWIMGEHVLRYLAVVHGDSVDIARAAQCKIGHIQHIVRTTIGYLQSIGAFGADDLVDELAGKLIHCGTEGCMRCKDAMSSNFLNVLNGCHAQMRVPKYVFKEGERKKCRVSFVHV